MQKCGSNSQKAEGGSGLLVCLDPELFAAGQIYALMTSGEHRPQYNTLLELKQ
jgi:hypothetical protein